jgi:ligand-binding SRPBCC domain-containing protein
MADYVLESRVWIARPRPDVFAFFADPANLPRVMPRDVIVTMRTRGPVTVEAGTVVDYRVQWLGVPLRWRAFIREYDPPYRFVDVQVRGPWARWEHRHLFLEEDGGTVMEDRVTYRPPLGPIGTLAHSMLLRRQLAHAWRVRRDRIAEYLGPVRPLRPRAE